VTFDALIDANPDNRIWQHAATPGLRTFHESLLVMALSYASLRGI
jgi:hypothetical protein